MNHLLHVVNASSNLVLISITGSEFRKTFMFILGLRTTSELNRNERANSYNRREGGFEMTSMIVHEGGLTSYQPSVSDNV